MIDKNIYEKRLQGLVNAASIPIPNNSEKEREFFIWIAGLLSTDGNMTHTRDSVNSKWYGTLNIVVSSCEKDWLEFIKNHAVDVGVKANVCFHGYTMKGKVPVYQIRFETRKTAFFLKYYAEDWLMPRKLGILNQYLNRPLISRLYNKMASELLQL